MTCPSCTRVIPTRPQYRGIVCAHVCAQEFWDLLGQRNVLIAPCYGTVVVLIGDGLQQRTLDRDEWWDL